MTNTKSLSKEITKDFLIEEYVIKHQDPYKISKQTGYSKTTLYRYIKKYGLFIDFRLKDIKFKKMGKLTPIKIIKINKKNTSSNIWLCNCECGRTTEIFDGNIRSGHTTSCGCNSSKARECPLCGLKTIENKCLCGFDFIVNTSINTSNNFWYVMGFLLADGCVSFNKDSDNFILSCFLKKDYGEIKTIDFMIKTLCPWVKSHEYERNVGGKIHKKVGFSVILNNQNVNDLKKYGIIPQKSLRSEIVPNVPENFFGSWLRGLFDGDGCIHNVKRGNRLSISAGNNDFLVNLDKIINKYLKIRTRIKNNKGTNSFYLVINRTDDIKKIAKIMYKNKDQICLDRKKKIFIERKLLDYE